MSWYIAARDELFGSSSNNEYTSNSLPTLEELDKFTQMQGIQAEAMAVQQYQKENWNYNDRSKAEHE